MEQSTRTRRGTLKVSENVIITITKNAAYEVSGVSSIANKAFSVSSLLRSKVDSSDVNVVMLDGVAKISMSIIVKSGYNILNVCEQIQEKVKAAVQTMTGVTVSKVNVSVIDVDFADKVEA
ncbi:MAG: Asp23/Gls24 family envelope stress response protein [Oscillospiraceae bacterium]|nr:Asp23/Gls24 family envelope stress response protein [Oscillospiraceae bacterium]